MPQIQTAPAPVESESTRQVEAPPQKLSLEEMIRIMDVATALRKEQAVVEQQLNLGETKAMLRERLLEAAQVTGENLTIDQIDVAIDSYYDKLHQFKKPAWSASVVLAHLYVMRGTIMKWAVTIAAVAGFFAWLG